MNARSRTKPGRTSSRGGTRCCSTRISEQSAWFADARATTLKGPAPAVLEAFRNDKTEPRSSARWAGWASSARRFPRNTAAGLNYVSYGSGARARARRLGATARP